MNKIILAMLALILSGCAYYTTPPIEEVVSRERVEAVNARSQCRALARNLVQIARCDGR
jgi:PBP1b-binding outer membrane lipoprotein LpoB